MTLIPAAFPRPLSHASLGSRGPRPARTALPPKQRPPAHLFRNASASSGLTRCRCALTHTTSPAGGLGAGFPPAPLPWLRTAARGQGRHWVSGGWRVGVGGRQRGPHPPVFLGGSWAAACLCPRACSSRSMRCGSCVAQSSPLALLSCARPAALNTRKPDVLVPLLPAPPGAYSRSSTIQGLRVLSRLLPPIQFLLLPFLPSLAFVLSVCSVWSASARRHGPSSFPAVATRGRASPVTG